MNVLESQVDYGTCQAAKTDNLRGFKSIPAKEAIPSCLEALARKQTRLNSRQPSHRV